MRLPKKRWKRILLYIVSTFFILLAADMALVQYWRHLTISPETTYLTTPLNSLGTPDYCAWLNERANQGVTPENNAAVPLLLAAGSEAFVPLAENWRQAAVPLLGMPAGGHPAKFVRFFDWQKARIIAAKSAASGAVTQSISLTDPEIKDLNAQEDQLMKAPWSASEHPFWAQWLDANGEAMNLLHEAAGRPKFGLPLLPGRPGAAISRPGDVFQSLLPSLAPVRNMADLLIADAMRRANEGNRTAALRDIIDVMKIGAVLTHRSTFIEFLVGQVILIKGHDAAIAILSHSDVASVADARAILAAIEGLSPSREVNFTGERCAILDVCCFAAKFGLYQPIFDRSSYGIPPKAVPFYAPLIPVNYNAAMRDINDVYNQIEEAKKLPTYRQRIDAMTLAGQRYDDGTGRWIEETVYPTVIVAGPSPGDPPPQGHSRPLLATFSENSQRNITRLDLKYVAIALLAYKAEKGQYPDTLSALTAGESGLLKSIPMDGFSDAPLIYHKEGSGFLLYSVGKDMNDDGGDEKADEVLRMER